MTEVLGLFGGTFDPVHMGHLQTAAAVRERYRLQRILFVVSARPPHRPPPEASPQHRMAMLQIALSDFAHFYADAGELDVPGPSYTVWTLRRMRARYPDRSIALLIGLDAYLALKTWYRWEEMITLVHLLILPRPGWNGTVPAGPVRWDDDPGILRRRAAGAVMLCEAPLVDVSATAIRRTVRQGGRPNGLVPPGVIDYIHAHGLYGATTTTI